MTPSRPRIQHPVAPIPTGLVTADAPDLTQDLAAICDALRAGDDATLTAFGRFLEPFITQIQRADKEFVLSPAAQSYLRAIAGGSPAGGGYDPAPNPASCVQ
jgi:hypothetical protein